MDSMNDPNALNSNSAASKDHNYWYYDSNSDGFYYEHMGSRGWRKRNPKLHGNPPLSIGVKDENHATSAPQTIEKVG